MMTIALRSLFVLLIVLSPLAAQEDEAGCKDHPLLTRMAGFYIDTCQNAEFDSQEFETSDENTVTVEGRKAEIRYFVKEGARRVSALQVLRNYLNAIRTAGGTVVWSDEHLGRGTARLAAGGRETWVAVRAFDAGDGCDLIVVEKQAMTQEISASEMLDALNRDGRIALNIQFDTGKSTIKSESAPIIEQMTALLQGNPALNVAVEGHTDNVGSAAANQTLSESRAKAVVAALAARGIAAGRMSSAGFGASKPVAPNDTEEGRARNRRVELVKR
ncbi:MAG: OmpA family protein [Bryobacterales bacterium]|jgi:outer membrane protein OmpA-like peptidoglycan-associated protein|nr:OmpA family protein [Bryobacterales bacterium]